MLVCVVVRKYTAKQMQHLISLRTLTTSVTLEERKLLTSLSTNPTIPPVTQELLKFHRMISLNCSFLAQIWRGEYYITLTTVLTLLLSLPNPDEPQTKALAQIKDAPETLDLAQVIAAVPAAHSPFNGLPPTPPCRPNPLTQTQGAPIKEGAYFPMRLFN